MDDPKLCDGKVLANEKVLKWEVFEPDVPDNDAIKNFTRGNEYPIYEEKYFENYGLFSRIEYRTINDEGKMVWQDARYFYLDGNIWVRYEQEWKEYVAELQNSIKPCVDGSLSYIAELENSTRNLQDCINELLVLAECDVRDKYKKQERHVPLEEYMKMVPIWRRLAEMTDSIPVQQQLQHMDNSLKMFMESAKTMRSKIAELLARGK